MPDSAVVAKIRLPRAPRVLVVVVVVVVRLLMMVRVMAIVMVMVIVMVMMMVMMGMVRKCAHAASGELSEKSMLQRRSTPRPPVVPCGVGSPKSSAGVKFC